MSGPRRCEVIEIPLEQVTAGDALKLNRLIAEQQVPGLEARADGIRDRLFVVIDRKIAPQALLKPTSVK